MGELTSFGFTPGRSVLHRMDPRTKQVLLILLGGVCLKGNIAFLGLLTLTLGLLGHAAGLSISRLIAETRYFLYLLVVVFIARAVRFSGSWIPVFSMGSMAEAGMVCWRLFLVVVMGILLVATTRVAHIRAALVWFLTPVPGVNSRMAATMVGLVVRFLPLILFQAAEMAEAQRARCIDRRKNPLAHLMHATIPLFRRVFLGADELAAAMQARCYSDHRTLPDLAFSRSDAISLGAALVISATAFLS
ncbi:cobalt transporter [Desulfosarcina ovata subsp. sediminis]|uniref:Cobalt transporter n=1 Tax=Desulfosarcina ovata subsp. sediminis TaxID=885957 RepID=A0A5K7ZF99_9BACT|nr:energy-coupling factor transporter transmembrane component T [Desulfosarcina ovata]BBO80752.1 cobalt transporter [Desulfosarcina ovata subsp. sediminis]